MALLQSRKQKKCKVIRQQIREEREAAEERQRLIDQKKQLGILKTRRVWGKKKIQKPYVGYVSFYG